jgi:hypothetical protein
VIRFVTWLFYDTVSHAEAMTWQLRPGRINVNDVVAIHVIGVTLCLMSLNCSHQQAHCLPSRWYMSTEHQGRMIMAGKRVELGGKPVPGTLCPPQIPHRLNWEQSQASTLRSHWLSAWAIAWPFVIDESGGMQFWPTYTITFL